MIQDSGHWAKQKDNSTQAQYPRREQAAVPTMFLEKKPKANDAECHSEDANDAQRHNHWG